VAIAEKLDRPANEDAALLLDAVIEASFDRWSLAAACALGREPQHNHHC